MSIYFLCFSHDHSKTNPYLPRAIEDFSLHGKRKLVHINYGNLNLWYPKTFSHTIHIDIDKNNGVISILLGESWGYDKQTAVEKGYPQMPGIVDNPRLIRNLLAEKGSAAIGDMDGLFNYIEYHTSNNHFYVYSDYNGLKPFYYTENPEFLFASSEFQPVFKVLNKKTINYSAISSYFLYGVPFDGSCIVNEITRLAPASVLMSKKENWKESRYDYSRPETGYFSFEKTVEHCCNMLMDLLERQLSDGKIEYYPITGGYDTRVLLSLFGEKKHDYEWTTNCSPFLNELTDKDVIVSKMICSKYNLRHKIRISSKEESDIFIRDKGLYEEVRHLNDSVNLNGHFSYYVRGQRALLKQSKNPRKGFLSKKMNSYCDYAKYSKSSNLLCSVIGQYSQGCMSIFVTLGSGGWISQASFFQRSFRTPFLGTSVVKYVKKMPSHYFENGKLYIAILKHLAPELLDIPFISRINDDSSIKILKAGVNYTNARKVNLHSPLTSYLMSPKTYNRGIYSPRYLLLLILKCILEQIRLPQKLREKLANHWRYKKLFPYDIADIFIKMECMLRDYVDR